MKTFIKKLLREVTYVNTNDEFSQEPSSDVKFIRVYHGFNNIEDLKKILKRGLSGQETVHRVYSHHLPKGLNGLFVSAEFNFAKKYANGGAIIEFSADINELIPSDDSFKTGYDNISFKTSSQAIYTGNLNPNMIKYVWYFENGEWTRYTRKDFVNKLNIDTKRSGFVKYLPNDDFSIDDFSGASSAISFFNKADSIKLKELGFFPKQIEQIMKLKADGFFEKLMNKN